MMSILALPPSGIITDADGILVGSSAGTSLLTGGTEGQAPIVQGDGSIAWGAAGASSLSELDDWSANTLTVPGALTVRQAGGVAGTDEVQIYHDGSDGYVQCLSDSGSNFWLSGSVTSNAGIRLYLNGTASRIDYYTRTTHMFYEDGARIWTMGDGYLYPEAGKEAFVGSYGNSSYGGLAGISFSERSTDPGDPLEGRSVMWQSDGTESGDDGDIMVKITAGGVTKTTTLIDFSAV